MQFFVLCSCRPLPPVQQTQREARQATFLFRRGLKVRDVHTLTLEVDACYLQIKMEGVEDYLH